jgi:hypothetical protein
MSGSGRWSAWNDIRGSGDESETVNNTTNNSHLLQGRKRYDLDCPSAKRKSGSGGPTQGPRSGRSVLRPVDLEPRITWKTNAGPLQTIFPFGINTTRSSRQ